MREVMLQWASEIEQNGAVLAQRYEVEALHVLRVRIRRTRSILKWMPQARARRFRQSWGGFASITGEARDWDVFDQTAHELLRPRQQATFARLIRDRLESSRATVVEMVTSAPWRRHLQLWKRFLADPGTFQYRQTLCEAWFDGASSATRRRLAAALDKDDDRSWHRLRIAVKNLRYLSDACGAHAGNRGFSTRVVRDCKLAQTLLGDWHDTVVQSQLLDELPDEAVCRLLRKTVVERQKRLRARCRTELSGHRLFDAGA